MRRDRGDISLTDVNKTVGRCAENGKSLKLRQSHSFVVVFRKFHHELINNFMQAGELTRKLEEMFSFGRQEIAFNRDPDDFALRQQFSSTTSTQSFEPQGAIAHFQHQEVTYVLPLFQYFRGGGELLNRGAQRLLQGILGSVAYGAAYVQTVDHVGDHDLRREKGQHSFCRKMGVDAR